MEEEKDIGLEPMLKLAYLCENPQCQRTPPFRITQSERRLALCQTPDQLKQTWDCRCGWRNSITAAAYQDAR